MSSSTRFRPLPCAHLHANHRILLVTKLTVLTSLGSPVIISKLHLLHPRFQTHTLRQSLSLFLQSDFYSLTHSITHSLILPSFSLILLHVFTNTQRTSTTVPTPSRSRFVSGPHPPINKPLITRKQYMIILKINSIRVLYHFTTFHAFHRHANSMLACKCLSFCTPPLSSPPQLEHLAPGIVLTGIVQHCLSNAYNKPPALPLHNTFFQHFCSLVTVSVVS